jgi:hypothetical protein
MAEAQVVERPDLSTKPRSGVGLDELLGASMPGEAAENTGPGPECTKRRRMTQQCRQDTAGCGRNRGTRRQRAAERPRADLVRRKTLAAANVDAWSTMHPEAGDWPERTHERPPATKQALAGTLMKGDEPTLNATR